VLTELKIKKLGLNCQEEFLEIDIEIGANENRISFLWNTKYPLPLSLAPEIAEKLRKIKDRLDGFKPETAKIDGNTKIRLEKIDKEGEILSVEIMSQGIFIDPKEIALLNKKRSPIAAIDNFKFIPY
jgi:hypothetical protein